MWAAQWLKYICWPFGLIYHTVQLSKMNKNAFSIFLNELHANPVFTKMLINNAFLISEKNKKAVSLFQLPMELLTYTTGEDRINGANTYIIERLLPISNTMGNAKVLDIISLNHNVLPDTDKVLVTITSAYYTQLMNSQKLLFAIMAPSAFFYLLVAWAAKTIIVFFGAI